MTPLLNAKITRCGVTLQEWKPTMYPNATLNFQKTQVPLFVTANGINAPGELPDPDEVFHCELWISKFCSKRKSINPRAFSYSLKHRAENWDSGLPNSCRYVSNGAFIQAAVNLGYQIKPDWINCFFNMSINKSSKAAV